MEKHLNGSDGFTLIELLVTMAVTLFVLTISSQLLVALMSQFKQQSKIAETSMESVVGLEILRKDIQSAGYGLPFELGTLPSSDYTEASGLPSAYNDASASPPRAVIANSPSFSFIVNTTDYLVIKSANAARNSATGKFALLFEDNPVGEWDPASENLDAGDSVIVLSPVLTNTISLITNDLDASSVAFANVDDYAPDANSSETYIAYGIDDTGADLRMPFNRADYYVSNDDAIRPSRCAGGTGVLVKGVVRHSNGALSVTPLLDCVADMQVGYRDDDDNLQDNIDNTTGLSDAESIRDTVREIRVYILAHEGQRDPNYTYGSTSVLVGQGAIGQNFDLTTITDYQNYRWKVYTVVEKPRPLR